MLGTCLTMPYISKKTFGKNLKFNHYFVRYLWPHSYKKQCSLFCTPHITCLVHLQDTMPVPSVRLNFWIISSTFTFPSLSKCLVLSTMVNFPYYTIFTLPMLQIKQSMQLGTLQKHSLNWFVPNSNFQKNCTFVF